MSFCSKCGTQIPDGVKFCPNCGFAFQPSDTRPVSAPTPVSAPAPTSAEASSDTTSAQAQNKFEKFTNTADTTSSYTAAQIESGKGMSILAYFSILVLIPIFAVKDNPYVRFHANQGLILLIGEALYAVAETILGTLLYAISWRLGYFFSSVFSLLYVAFGVLAIIGILNAVNGKAKEIPIVGKFKILK